MVLLVPGDLNHKNIEFWNSPAKVNAPVGIREIAAVGVAVVADVTGRVDTIYTSEEDAHARRS